jgi:threonyl-tRNA synthetase
MDLRNEKIGYKIREHTMLRTPYLLVVGDKELESGKISVRTRLGDDLGEMSVENLIKMIETLVDKRSINLTI